MPRGGKSTPSRRHPCPTTLEANKTLIHRLYERLMANGDVAAADEILADGYLDHSVLFMAAGRAELIGPVQAISAAIPDIAPTVDRR